MIDETKNIIIEEYGDWESTKEFVKNHLKNLNSISLDGDIEEVKKRVYDAAKKDIYAYVCGETTYPRDIMFPNCLIVDLDKKTIEIEDNFVVTYYSEELANSYLEELTNEYAEVEYYYYDFASVIDALIGHTSFNQQTKTNKTNKTTKTNKTGDKTGE